MILAIDTATAYASLALYSPNGIFAEETWHSGRNHTVELMPRLARMLKLAGIQVNALTALAVSLGPGSFTGVRLGLAAAKGLALPHKLPVIGVPTLEIIAYPFRLDNLPVWVIVQAGRGRILAACYGLVEDQWGGVVEPMLTTMAELAPKIDQPALCAGEIDPESAQILWHGTKASLASPAARLRRAGYLAEIAAAHLTAGYQDDPDALAPIYISTP